MNHVECIMSIRELNLKLLLLQSCLCNYSYVYILVNGTITVADHSKIA